MLDLTNIQGNVLHPFHMPAARYAFLSIPGGSEGRALIAHLAQETATEAQPFRDHRSAVNVGLTYEGLFRLGLPSDSLASFSEAFRAGMPARQQQLNDVGLNSPQNWQDGLGMPAAHGRLHLYVSVHAESPSLVAERFTALGELFERHDAQIRFTQDGLANADHTEHFGFRDALADTAVEGTSTPTEGHGLPLPDGTWRGIKPGEFLFGYDSELGVPPLGPRPDVLSKDGTYLVFRKLYQNAALFHRYLHEQAERLRVDFEWLAAKIVGRWRDGTPLALSPDSPWGDQFDQNALRNNVFRYADDRDGIRVPRGAHIRRVNPRDGLAHGIDFIRSHRIIRRGLPYGPRLPAGAEDDGIDRGIVFLAINANIADQFEFVQSTWIESGSFAGLHSDEKDACMGGNDGEGLMTIPMPDGTKKRLFSLPRFTTVRFGAYVFLPGIQGLRWIGAGTW